MSAEEKIKNAFLEMYAEKPIEKISVSGLTEKAGINRGTFYDHYLDIYDLRDRLENRFMENAVAIVQEVVDLFMTGDVEKMAAMYTPFYTENRQMLDVFLVKRPSDRMRRMIKGRAKESVCRHMGLEMSKLTVQQRYTMEYIAGGQYAMATMWFASGQDLTVDDFIDLIKNLNLRGAFTCLAEGTSESSELLKNLDTRE